jgi:hypothetical protein
MASIIFPIGWRLTDSNGKPVNNGKIYVYDAGTTDEASTYSDSALSAALAQPIRTNSAGFPITSGSTPCLIYVAAGANYKVAANTSADAEIFAAIDDYPPLGRDSGTVAVNEGGTGATTAAGARTNLGAAAASDLTTVTSTVTTIAGERAAIPNGAFNDLAGLDTLTPDYMEDVKRVCIQEYFSASPSGTSINSSIPVDTSTPLVSEGVQVFTTSFTPLRDDTTLEITVSVNIELPADAQGVLALFAGSTCLDATAEYYYASAARYGRLELVKRYAPGSTSAITVSARMGCTTGTGTVDKNFTGVANSYLHIKELRAT